MDRTSDPLDLVDQPGYAGLLCGVEPVGHRAAEPGEVRQVHRRAVEEFGDRSPDRWGLRVPVDEDDGNASGDRAALTGIV